MRVLCVNAGSSSLKLSLVAEDDTVLVAEEVDAGADYTATLTAFAERVGEVAAVAHRLVHGGPQVRHAVVVDAAVRRRLEAAAAIAPLHVPPALELLDAAARVVSVPQVVCVDTAFHAGLPDHATTYAIPERWRALGVHRYGFHGLSYAWSCRRAAELLDLPVADVRLLMAHVGSGVSVCATRGGHSVDTSMGFTPLEGAVMAQRSGTVDPGALLWLQQTHGVTAAEMSKALEHSSGLLGLCGASDVREVERAADGGDARSGAALDVYVHALCRSLGGAAASLDRVDALVFTGGVGEHSALVRSRVCAGLRILGIDAQLSDAAPGADAVIGTSTNGTAVVVVVAREDAEMAREARALLAGPPGHDQLVSGRRRSR